MSVSMQHETDNTTEVNLDTAVKEDFAGAAAWYLESCETRRFDREHAVRKTAAAVGMPALQSSVLL
jgi:hypothetical protein